MTDISRIIRKFERMMNMPSDKVFCRDYSTLEELKYHAQTDAPKIQTNNLGQTMGTFVYDFKNGTEEFIPSKDYLEKISSVSINTKR